MQAMGPTELYHYLWATKYVPLINDTLRKEGERRMHAFADDVTFVVCGEELRLMTPHDLHLLDREDNAFVCATEYTKKDLAWFLWTLNVQNDGTDGWRNRFRRGKCYARIAARDDLDADAGEVYGYLDRLWIDTPADEAKGDGKGGEGQKDKRPPTVYCIAPLLVNVAISLQGSAIDPMSGRLLGFTPIPRLLQYQRAGMERKTGEREATSFDSYRSKCLEEVNNIMAARRAAGK